MKDFSTGKSGHDGSGKMQLWIRVNPKNKQGFTLDKFKEQDFEFLAPAYQNLEMALNAAMQMEIIMEKLNRAKLALAGKIPLSKVEDTISPYRIE